MCFLSTKTVKVQDKPVVERKQADADVTKNSMKQNQSKGINQNIKTTQGMFLGSDDENTNVFLGD